MAERTATIRNEHGIHCRPSAAIIQHTESYDGDVMVTAARGQTTLHSVLELVSLELLPGCRVTIHVNGPDEERFSDELVELFERHFDFPQQDD